MHSTSKSKAAYATALRTTGAPEVLLPAWCSTRFNSELQGERFHAVLKGAFGCSLAYSPRLQAVPDTTRKTSSEFPEFPSKGIPVSVGKEEVHVRLSTFRFLRRDHETNVYCLRESSESRRLYTTRD